MRRARLAGLFAAVAFLLAACGSSSITVLRTSPAAAIVITSDSNAISSLKPKLQAALQAGETLVDGDQHTGDHFCGFSLSKNGHSYQVDAYGTLPNTTCSQATQDSLKSQLP